MMPHRTRNLALEIQRIPYYINGESKRAEETSPARCHSAERVLPLESHPLIQQGERHYGE